MIYDIPVLNQTFEPTSAIIIKQEPEEPSKLYTIKQGDNLTKVAKAFQTSVDRLWDKNAQLDHPDQLEAGEVLKIPENDEKLTDRPMPTISPSISSSPVNDIHGATYPAPSTSNLYYRGYCTWYVKSVRPDIPNNMGDASSWYYNYPGAKGSTPRVGAVAVTKAYSHVAIVVAVKGSSVVIREMNYVAWNVVSTRTAPISEFLYLY